MTDIKPFPEKGGDPRLLKKGEGFRGVSAGSGKESFLLLTHLQSEGS